MDKNDWDNWECLLGTLEYSMSEHRMSINHRIIDTFLQISDKQRAWGTLLKLTERMILNKDHQAGWCMSIILGSTFPSVPNQQKAWLDLVILTVNHMVDKNSRLIKCMPSIFESVFSHVTDQEDYWQNITCLCKINGEKEKKLLLNLKHLYFLNLNTK